MIDKAILDEVLPVPELETLKEEKIAELKEEGFAITNFHSGGVFYTLLLIVLRIKIEFTELLRAILNNMTLTHSTGAWLDIKAADYGKKRKKAQKTQGLVTLSRTNDQGEAVKIEKGHIFKTQKDINGEELRFFAIEAAVLQKGSRSVDVLVEAEKEGSRYNVPEGQITRSLTFLNGIDGISNGEDWIVREGSDTEDDEGLRTRALRSWSELAARSIEDTFINAAEAVQGVLFAQADCDHPRGQGTVDVIVTGTAGEATEGLLDEVREAVDKIAGPYDNILVKSSETVPQDCFDENQTVEQNTQIPESLALFEKYHGAADGRIHIDFSIHAEYTCKSHIVKAYSDLCREKGGRMHIHLAETAREQRECIERYGKTPTEWFESLGTFDSPTAAAHCVAVTERDMDILKAHGVSVIHNPTSNLKLGSGFAPIRQMMDKGINVTLGTDGTASNNNLNMFEEMHLAEIMHDGYHNDPTLISTQEVLDMATVNGAKLQGRDDTGVLAVGKKADIIAIDLSKPHLYPNFDTPALLTCSAQAGDVCMTMVDGNILYENGEFKTLDENKVRADMERAVERLYRK